MIAREKPPHHDPGLWLSAVNRLIHNSIGDNQFATMFFGTVKPGSTTLRFAACGGPDPVLITPAGAIVLDGSDVPIGVDPMTRYETREARLSGGDSLLLYSDALMESKQIGHPPLEGHGVAAFCSDLRGTSSLAAMEHLLTDVIAPRRPLVDDLTLIWLRQLPH